MGEQGYIGVAKVSAAGENAAQKNGSIDRRNFGIPDAVAAVDIGPVVKKTAMMNELVGKKFEG